MKYRISKRNKKTFKDDQIYRDNCFKEKLPMIWISAKKKYCSITWDFDSRYPWYDEPKGTLDELEAIVKPYSLQNSGYGMHFGYIGKVHIALGPELAEKIFDFLVEHVRQVEFDFVS